MQADGSGDPQTTAPLADALLRYTARGDAPPDARGWGRAAGLHYLEVMALQANTQVSLNAEYERLAVRQLHHSIAPNIPALQVIEGPIGRDGGRSEGKAVGISSYVRDPDGNLVEFIIY